MKKILLAILMLGMISQPGFCNKPPVQLELTVDKTEIFTTEFPVYTVRITNTGSTNIQVIDTDYKGADKQWLVDSSRVALGAASYIGDRWQSQGLHELKLGESYNDKPRIYFPERISNPSWNSSIPEPITLRIGFRITPDARPIWSNPITIRFKRYEDRSTKNKLEFQDINLDGYCYPVIFHIKGVFPRSEQPIIESQLVVDDEQTYEQFLKMRRGVPGRRCDEDKAYKECMKIACSGVVGVGNDEQKRLPCAENLCRVSAPREVKGCEAEQECLKKDLPPIDFTHKTLLGQFTQGDCGTTGFKREVFRDDKAKTITYFVSAINTIADCMKSSGGQSLNLIAIPKIPADYKVIFSYKTQ